MYVRKVLVLFTLLVGFTTAADFNLPIGQITIPKGISIYIVAIKSPSASSFAKDVACTNTITCVAYYLLEKGISSLVKLYIGIEVKIFTAQELMQIVDAIRVSNDKHFTLMTHAPDIANIILIPKSDFKPIIDVLWNGTHYLFTSIYPAFDDPGEIAEYTYKLYVHYCLPIIKDGYLSRCRVSDPYLYAEIGSSRMIFPSSSMQINKVRSNSSWWATISDSIMPDISILVDSPAPLQITDSFRDNFFTSKVIGEFFIFQHGDNIEVRRYGSGNQTLRIKSHPTEITILPMEQNTVIFIYNKTSDREYPVFGYINKTYIYQIVVDVSASDLESIIADMVSSVMGAEHYITWIIRNWRTVLTIIVITLIGMVIVYLLTLIKPFLSCLAKLC